MRAALYFPHTEIRSEQLVRTSLLLWDTVDYIAPYDGYVAQYTDRMVAKAMDLIGRRHCPNDDEKKEAHAVIEEFATRALPAPFYYRRTNQEAFEDYEMWPQKLMYETWDLLRNLQLAGNPLANADYPLSQSAGLSLMSILAECCAGETRARITDQGIAYATLTNLLVDDTQQHAGAPYEFIVPLTLKLLDISKIPLEKLIAFREREEKESGGHTLTILRHNYLKLIEGYAVEVSKMTRKNDREERSRQFESDMRVDLKHLSQELWGAKVDVIFSKEAVVSVLAAVTAAVGVVHGVPLAIPAATSIAGGAITVGGSVLIGNKYLASRRATMQKHPMAYLYELSKS